MTDAAEIVALDDATVDRIAAGEVVERPASAVKELVENSLDAGAERIEVAVERAGKDLVRVADDGAGMTEAALRKAVEQHTTSKIRHVDDLEAGVATLGFRGEALHTIGAVSRLTIRTKPPGVEVGTELRLVGGEVEAVEPVGCPTGTIVEVADLFFNTPAREQYLRQDRTEFARVNDVVSKYALANPGVAVSLTHDGRDVFATPGDDDRRSAVMAVYGREVAESMRPVEASPAGPLERVTGLVSHPETTRSSRDYVSTFVNGRFIRSRPVREAVVEAYGTQLAPDRYPFAVLFLSVDADRVDVNVHPRKLEVRFADAAGVREQVTTAVREALLSAGLLRSGAPRGRSAPGETSVRPGAAGDRPGGRGGDADGTGDDVTTGTDDGATGTDDAGGWLDRVVEAADVDGEDGFPGRAPSGTAEAADATGRANRADRSGASTADEPADGGRVDRVDHGRPGRSAGTGSSDVDRMDPSSPSDAAGTAAGEGEPAAAADGDDAATPRPTDGWTHSADWVAGSSLVDESSDLDPGRKFGDTEQRTLTGETAAAPREYERLPPLRVLGQYDDTYVVATAPDGVVLVDQHAADERVNYERLRAQFGGETASQALAEPVTLELTAGEAALFAEYRPALARLGFEAAPAGERTVEVRSVPAVISDALDPALLRDVLSRAMSEADETAAPVEARADELLADLACYPSITGNTPLSEGSVLELLAALDGCENPYACPHGRPVLVHLDDAEIADRFERDYPGHAGRRE